MPESTLPAGVEVLTCACRTVGAGLLYTTACPLPWHRARACVGTGIYQAGMGGLDPALATPFANGEPNGRLDCSGGLSYWWRLARSLKANGPRSANVLARRFWREVTMGGYAYLSTDSLVRDANGSQLVVRRVKPGEEVRAGDGVVYPGTFKKIERTGQSPTYKRLKMGHCGIVVEVRPVPAGGTVLPWRYTTHRDLSWLRIVHCNAGAAPAIDETSGDTWARNPRSIVVRLRDDLPR